MTTEQYCFSWDSFKNNICNGFANLQQREEFVDMTLVADGHLVKVHKNLMALASPLLKEMILSAPCKHPVIFLNNVSHIILNYLLEYIYTGKVMVEPDKLNTFLKTSQELHLHGIEKVVSTHFQDQEYLPVEPTLEVKNNRTEINNDAKIKNISENIPLLTNIDVKPTTSINLIRNGPNEFSINIEKQPKASVEKENNDMSTSLQSAKEVSPTCQFNNNNSNVDDIEMTFDSDIACNYDYNVDINVDPVSKMPAISIDTTGSLPQQYTVSNRGSLQIILNRYIYYMHHQASQGLKRRWRCIDYRSKHCTAYIDTFQEKIITRKNIHGHPYHDDKIMKKVKAKQIYASYDIAIVEAKYANEKQEYEINLSD